MQVTIHAAKTNLSKLIEAASAGEEVIIAKGRTPVARIVPIAPARFNVGILKDALEQPIPDFLEPLDADDLDLWEGRR